MHCLTFLIKPASSLCGLRCRYCFYADEAANRQLGNMGLMSEQTVDLLLTQAFSTISPGGSIQFTFQGGEPTLVGLAWFQSFTSKARLACPDGVQLRFSIQTNGMELDASFAEFFHREHYLVGLSIDGFRENHNLWRVDTQGDGTWSRAVKALRLLQNHNVDVNVLCVVTGHCARNPEKAYKTLKNLGARYLQFIACLDPIAQERGGQIWSVTAEEYGSFLCRLFDLWYQDWAAGDYCSIRLFEDYVHLLLGDQGGTCSTCGNCGQYLLVEADGSVYPCDFFALDNWKLGSLREDSLESLLTGQRAQDFLAWGSEKPEECASCPWKILCNGGCKNDWLPGDKPHNVHCQAFRRFFAYSQERLITVARAEQAARRRG